MNFKNILITVFALTMISFKGFSQSQLTISSATANPNNSAAVYAYNTGSTQGWNGSIPMTTSDYITFDLGSNTNMVTQITLAISKSTSTLYAFDIYASNSTTPSSFSYVTTKSFDYSLTGVVNLTIDALIQYRYVKFKNFRFNSSAPSYPIYVKNVKIFGDSFTSSGNMIINGNLLTFGKIGIGCNSLVYPLCVNGKIQATEVEIKTTPCSDYVFDPEYTLKSIQEVEQYIVENKHLPEIPSASEFSENGYNLGEMDNLLLKKVEELTLYLIKQDKLIQEQSKKIESLQDELNTIKEKDIITTDSE